MIAASLASSTVTPCVDRISKLIFPKRRPQAVGDRLRVVHRLDAAVGERSERVVRARGFRRDDRIPAPPCSAPRPRRRPPVRRRRPEPRSARDLAPDPTIPTWRVALPRDDAFVVVRRYEVRAGSFDHFVQRGYARRHVRRALGDDAAVTLDRRALDARCVVRDDDVRRYATDARGDRERGAVIAGRVRRDAARRIARRSATTPRSTRRVF